MPSRLSFFAHTPDPVIAPCEVDETYLDGKRKNVSHAKRKAFKEAGLGRRTAGKTAVVGIRGLETNEVRAKVVDFADKETLHPFIEDNAPKGTTVCTDDASVYDTLSFLHESVKHPVSEDVREQAYTNGMESSWWMLKRAYTGTVHKLSPEHLGRYVQEFTSTHNLRECGTQTRMDALVRRMEGRKLRSKERIRDNGLSSMVRS